MNKVNVWAHRLLLVPVFILIAFAVELTVWALDRDPPFEILSVEPAMVLPGNAVQLTATVRRDLDRNCSVTYTRHLYDGANYRHDLEGSQSLSGEAIRAMNIRSPNMLHVALRVPDNAAAGTAALVTALDYECNPLHSAWPIHVVTEMQFTILEPP
jgi:hypothetical protein